MTQRTQTLRDALGTPAWLQAPWDAPSVAEARRYANREKLLEGRGGLCGASLAQFDEASIGLGLHFRLLKYYAAFFALASFIMFPAIVMAAAGRRLDTGKVDLLGLARVSIANIGDSGPPGNYTISPWLRLGSSTTYSAADISALVMACDFLVVALFYAFYLFVRWRVHTTAQALDEAQVTGSDYTVYVSNVPVDATEDEIRGHFSSLYDLYGNDWTHRSSWRTCYLNRKTRPRPRAKQPPPEVVEAMRRPERLRDMLNMRQAWAMPVLDVDHNQRPGYLGSWVADVSVAGPAREAVYALRDRVHLVRELERCKAAVRRYRLVPDEDKADADASASRQLTSARSMRSVLSTSGGMRKDPDTELRHRRTQSRSTRPTIAQLRAAAYDSDEEWNLQTCAAASTRAARQCRDSIIISQRRCARGCRNWCESGDTRGRDHEDDTDLSAQRRAKRRAFALAALYASASELVTFDRKHPTVPGSTFRRPRADSFRSHVNMSAPAHASNAWVQRMREALEAVQDGRAARAIFTGNRPVSDHACVGAFVTFQDGECVRRCLDDYAPSQATFFSNPFRWIQYMLQPEALRFRGVHKLKVTRACDPSLILWENLEVPPLHQCLRQAVTAVIITLLVIACFTAVVISQAKVKDLQNTIPNVKVCHTLLPGVAFNLNISSDGSVPAMATALPLGVTLSFTRTDDVCSMRAEYRLSWRDNNGTRQPITAPFHPNPCLNECVPPKWFLSPQYSPVCTVPTTRPGTNATFLTSASVTCYCYEKLQAAIRSRGLLAGSSSALTDDGAVCQPALLLLASSYALLILASLITVVTNNLLRLAIRRIAEYEAHHTIDELHRAVATKTFLATFINTSVIVLLLNASMPPPLDGVKVDGTPLFAGTYSTFDLQWHVNVGAAICLNMLFNTLTAHMNFIATSIVLPCKRVCLRTNNAFTQEQLNERFTPDAFELQARSAVTMATLFSCLMYSAGHPILLPIASVSFFIAYWIDKVGVLKVFRKPPVYGSTLASWQLALLPYAGIIHMVVAIWMYSQPGVLLSFPVGLLRAARRAADIVASQSESIQGVITGDGSTYDAVQAALLDRITQQNTLPLVVLLSFVLACALLYIALGRPLLALLRVIFFAMCRRCGCVTCIQETVARSRVFRRARQCLGLRSEDEVPVIPPFTGTFRLLVPCTRQHELPPERSEQGWRIQHAFRRSDWLYRVGARPPPGTAVVTGKRLSLAPHLVQRALRTYEVIALSSLRSYRIVDNPVYSAAVQDEDE